MIKIINHLYILNELQIFLFGDDTMKTWIILFICLDDYNNNNNSNNSTISSELRFHRNLRGQVILLASVTMLVDMGRIKISRSIFSGKSLLLK